MRLIIGLGNPEEKYNNTRHNFGFLFLDYLVKYLSTEEQLIETPHFVLDKKLQAKIIRLNNLILAKPQTYMNESGKSVEILARHFQVTPEEIVVAHDDLDLTFGSYKNQINRSPAGHHGVESIIARLGTQNFRRLRLGIAPKTETDDNSTQPKIPGEKYVLQKFPAEELDQLPIIFDKIIEENKQLFNTQ